MNDDSVGGVGSGVVPNGPFKVTDTGGSTKKKER